MSKKISFALALLFLVGLIVGFLVWAKGAQFAALAAAAEANEGPPPETVSTFEVERQTWERGIDAVGTIEPIRGVVLEAEVPGVVESITFENGQDVSEGDVLVQLDIRVEQAQLRAAKAEVSLAEIEYERNKRLRESGSVPQSQLDRAAADLEKARAEIENIEAVIDRKTIRAPFDGKAGIRRINLGQYLSAGTPVVALQAFDRVFVNFNLPQQNLGRIESGMPLEVASDSFPGKRFEGTVTAVSPQIDAVTRSVEIQGTIDNPSGRLRSGLFVRVRIQLPGEDNVLVVPATALLYAPYGNSVYRVIDSEDGTGEGPIARQAFVRIGRRQGDFVAIEDGVKEGDTIVSAGAFKLRNNAPVRINNELAPKPELDPTPPNS